MIIINKNLKTFFCTSFLVIIIAAGIVYSIGLDLEIINPDTVFAQVDITALSIFNTSSLNFDPDTGKFAEASSTINRQITLIAQDAELEIAPGKIVKTWTLVLLSN